MGRILAIDYGQKRVGLAVTDPLQLTANGLDTVLSHELFNYLRDYVQTEKVEKFVVGLPKQLNGEDSDSMKLIRPFITGLERAFPHIPVVLFDERFTSTLAHRTLLASGAKKKDRQNKALVDKIAATILLQSYLNSTNYATQ
ncbi:MAG: Holliday junction DNA helicase RuvA [Paludibacter sp. 47-17]|jgi:putative Holliday junction resolvase|nr:MAG: Holliday junction DNA helicase RuvA [Paludibacter sp. 47-17]